jgi:GNAT superfamily N-acetyltransferase
MACLEEGQVDIRRACADDHPELMRLYDQFIGVARYRKMDNDSFRFLLDDPSHRVAVAATPTELCGFAATSARRVVRYLDPVAELEELYVDDRFRRRGVGSRLLVDAEGFAVEMGCCRLFVATAFNKPDGPMLYRQAGFTENGRHYVRRL